MAETSRKPKSHTGDKKQLRICFVSFEYPWEVNPGGIATYIHQISEMLCQTGHSIHVLTAGSDNLSTVSPSGVNISLIKCKDQASFRELALEKFLEINSCQPIDIVETPDWGADAIRISEALPDMPLVMRLHTSTMQLFIINNRIILMPWYFLFAAILRISANQLLPRAISYACRIRGFRWAISHDITERNLASMCDLLVAPTPSMAKFSRECWGFKRNKYRVVPYPFSPSAPLLAIDPPSSKYVPEIITILFIGRLEARKGVIDLVKSIPIVLNSFPNTILRLVGPIDESPSGGDMVEYLEKHHKIAMKNVEVAGNILYDAIPGEFAKATICAFPSLWENFPNVCLEAMSAAKPIIGSSNGGMRDMLKDGAGLLVRPGDHKELARSVIRLLSNPTLMHTLATNARNKILSQYSSRAIGEQHVSLYREAISLHGH